MTHLIKKQLIEFKLNEGSDAFRMQHLISSHFNHKILPAIESIFNDYCREDEVLKLDKLEIDLGAISIAEMEQNNLDEKIVAAFKTKLREKLALVTTSKSATRESMAMNICRQWITYMQTGYLPWNTLEINEAWHQQVLEALATDYASITMLRNLVSNHSSVGHRIAQQHTEVFLTKLVEIITAKNQHQLPAIAEELYVIIKALNKSHEPPIQSRIILIKAIWQQVLIDASADPNNFSTETFALKLLRPYITGLTIESTVQQESLSQLTLLRQTLSSLFKEKNIPHLNKTSLTDSATLLQKENLIAIEKEKELTQKIKDIPINEVKKSIDNDVEKETKKAEKRKKSVEKKQDQNKSVSDKETETFSTLKESNIDKTMEDKINVERTGNISDQGIEEQRTLFQNLIKNILPGNNLSKETISNKALQELIPEEGIFINHAGIVLSHPFLIHLFGRLNWLHNKKFIDEEKRQKAVFLLHYLASGQPNAAEHSLALYKILCAHPLDLPMPAEVDFAEEELAEATDMLTALILQWSKLQNTSINGLREGFLQRKGKLYIKNTEPFLQVETSAIDVLLDYLPWNLSMVKLPWMKEILRVEWR